MFSGRLSGQFMKIVGVGLVVATASMLGGCNKKTKAELADLRSEVETLRDQNAQLESTLTSCENQKNSLQTQVSDLQTQLAARPTDTGSGGRQGYQGDSQPSERERIILSGDVLFASGQATILAAAKPELDGVARQLKGQYSGADVRIEGYTDSDPLVKSKAKWGTNERLSEARAEAVKEYLASKGVESGRMDTVGMGAARPKSTKKASRRVEIVVLN